MIAPPRLLHFLMFGSLRQLGRIEHAVLRLDLDIPAGYTSNTSIHAGKIV